MLVRVARPGSAAVSRVPATYLRPLCHVADQTSPPKIGSPRMLSLLRCCSLDFDLPAAIEMQMEELVRPRVGGKLAHQLILPFCRVDTITFAGV